MVVRLEAIVTFDVQSGKAREAAKDFQALGDTVERAGRRMGSHIPAGWAFSRMGDALIKRVHGLTAGFGDFDLEIQRAKGVLGPASDQVGRLINAVKGMRDVEHSPAALARSLTDLNRAGIGGTLGLQNLRTAADVATVAQL